MATTPFHERLYKYGLWTSYVLFALTTFGLWSAGLEILSKLELLLSFYIALFLIYNFNPYTVKPVKEFARGIAFSAGILLLITKISTKVFTQQKREDTRQVSEILYDVIKIESN